MSTEQLSSQVAQSDPADRSVPAGREVNPIDHIIGHFGGTTMALELLHSRVQAAKKHTPLPSQEHGNQLRMELTHHEQENKYYHTCYDSYQKLLSNVVEVHHYLKLQALFEPGSTPAQDPFLYDAVRKLSAAVAESRTCEVQAAIAWKQYWNIPIAKDIPMERI